MITNSKFQIVNFIRVHSLKDAFCFAVCAIVFCLFVSSAAAQRRDHLTEAEVEIVRDVQQVDRRMEVFIKAIDRRFLLLNNDTSQMKQTEKDSDKWGEPPIGTRLQLLTDIEKILEEAISKIDDVAARDMKNELFPSAVNILAEGADRLLPQFKLQLDKSTDEKEKGVIIGSIDYCNQILAASAKVPKLTTKEIKKIRSRKDKEESNN